ncbi:MAG: histidine kinase, partial [Candidatus Aminicenantes bacterium]|nr:histidine kinase [Candidatus Aminicenantes bacterium]
MKRSLRSAVLIRRAAYVLAFGGFLLAGGRLAAGSHVLLPADDAASIQASAAGNGRESEAPPLVSLFNWRVKAGDDPAWARPDHDDSGWENREIAGRFAGIGTFWLRKTVEVTGRFSESDPPMISIYNLPSAFEVFWDGELIGCNGRWGRDRGQEFPGTTRFLQAFSPRRAEPGVHLLAIRISNFHVQGKTIVTGIGLGPLGVMNGYLRRMVEKRLVSMGLYFVAALFGFFLFIRRRKNFAFLYFGGFSLLFFLHSLWIYLIERMGLRLGPFAVIEVFIIFGIPAAFIMLDAFLLWHYDFRPRPVYLAGLALAMAGAAVFGSGLVGIQARLIAVPVAFGFVLAVILAVRGKRGWGMALVGTAIPFANHVLIFFIPGLTPFLEALPGYAEMVLTALVLSMFMGIIALCVRDENRSLEILRIRSQRLSAELLKKSIQPHFIMNTLLSAQSWFGRDPDKAGRLIEALAEEFRIISRIVSELEIDLAEEIALCRSHLELMGYRRDAVYRLVVNGDVSRLKTPPMLFHTLIENGLTHAFEARENGTFTLTCESRPGEVEFQLENDGSRL